MASSSDIKKLSHILQENESDSDSASIDSNELEIDCELYDILKNSTDNTIKKCKDPLLKRALICNVKKRRILEEIINKLENHLIRVKQVYKECRSTIMIESKSKYRPRLNFMKKRLGTPYFKDNTAFPSPENADSQKIRDSKQYIQNDLLQNVWLTEDKYNLLNGVFNDVCSKKAEELTKQIERDHQVKSEQELIESLQYERKIFIDTELIGTLLKKWSILHKLRTEYPKSPEQIAEQLILEIVCEWDKKIDWLKISSYYVDGRHTDVECEAMWNCYVNPKFSKDSWKLLENSKLMELAEKHEYQNWDEIALELDTNRSGYQCCVHFHAKLCEKFHRDKWTPEEDKHLQSVVENCRVGSYISWGKVAYYFKHRTKIQIYRHYTTCMQKPVKKGAFSVEEDILLLTAMKIYNRNMKKVSLHFPNRISEQLRSRLKTLNTNAGRAWTPQEDAKIIHYVANHGQKNWKVLKEEFNRSEACIRHRYKTIKKYIQLNSTIFHIPRREHKNTRNQTRRRQKFVKKVVAFLVHKLNTTTKISNYLNIDYIKEIMNPFLNESETEKQNSSKKENLRESTPEINIHFLLTDFFKSSYKKVIRSHEVINDNYVNSSADRVEMFLKLLGANLNFPNLDQIRSNPMLDDIDIQILTRLVSKQEFNNCEPSTSKQQSILSIPPSIENLIGFRGILLHLPVLKNHGHCKYIGYPLYVKTKPNISFISHSYTYNKHKLESSLVTCDTETKEAVLHQRQLFFNRLQLLFKWSLIIADTKAEPVQDKTPEPAESESKVKQKAGRKRKNVKHYKVQLMNVARRSSAAEKRKLTQANDDNSNKKIKLD